MDELVLSVKTTSNYPFGYPPQRFILLSPVWSGNSLLLPFRESPSGTPKHLEVTGWTDVFRLGPCPVHVARVQAETGSVGYVVYGGTAGVRVLDKEAPRKSGVDEYLPRGYGRPYLWIALEDKSDLPEEVRQVVDEGRK